MAIRHFEDIEAWQLARELTRQVYARTASRAFSKDFGLRDQIERTAGSAMHNIAEGFDSGSDVEFIRFLRCAQRSCTEVQSELYVALDQRYLTPQEFDALYDRAQKVRAKIGGFIRYLLSSTKDVPRRRTAQPTSDERPRSRRLPLRMTKDQGLAD